MSRKYTTRLLELVEDGTVDKDVAIQACLEYMSEADVKDMMISNDFPIDTDVADTLDYQDFDETDWSDGDDSIDPDDRYD